MARRRIFPYKGRTITLEQSSYNNGTMAVIMRYMWGAREEEVITVNLDNSGFADNEYQFVDINHFPDMPKWLEKHKIAEPTCLMVRSGFCDFPLYKFNLRMLGFYKDIKVESEEETETRYREQLKEMEREEEYKNNKQPNNA